MNKRSECVSGRPTVSIIMNCLNGEKYLREAIDSVYAQTYKDWEIIFWDNASTDNSAEIAKSYGEKLRYFRGNKTVPLGKARNLAIENAKGKYIAFLDCDDIWLPEKLEKQIPFFEHNQKLGLVYSDAYRIDKDGRIIGVFSDDIYFPRGDAFLSLVEDGSISAQSSVIVSRVSLEKVGLFNVEYHICEEYELFLRIAEYFEFDYVDLPLVKFRHHEGNASRKVDDSVNESLKIQDDLINRRADLITNHKHLIAYSRYKYYGKLAVFHFMNVNLLMALKATNQSLSHAMYNPKLVLKGIYINLVNRRIKRFIRKYYLLSKQQ